MAKMRSAKQRLRLILQASDWQAHLDAIAAGGMTNVGPLFSFLLLGPQTMHRAAVALGRTVARLEKTEPEAARNVIRRFMWHMNEESGNIGWGIPEAFAECLAASPALAETYHRILISTIMDLGREDNYCDNDVLRRSCYWAVGRLAEARPALCEQARPWLRKGLGDEDIICRGMAAWTLGRLPPNLMDAPALRALAGAGCAELCEIYDYDNDRLDEISVSDLARRALARETDTRD